MSSAFFSTATASSFITLMSRNGRRPGFSFTPECQQLMVDIAGMRSFHPLVTEKPGRKPFRDIKLMKEDAAAVEQNAEEIKAHYTKIFRV